MSPEDQIFDENSSEEIELQDGANVFSADGKKVGSVERVVIDPRSKRISNLVVRQGTILVNEKVVPANLVELAEKDKVVLKDEAGDLDSYPTYNEAHYIPLDPYNVTGRDPGAMTTAPNYPPRFYPYPPVGMTPTNYPVFVENYTVHTESHIPSDNLVIKEGAKVISADGRHVGNVERVIADPEEGAVTHLLIAKGLLLKEHKLIPMDWVESIGKDDMHLAVDASLLERLEPYKE